MSKTKAAPAAPKPKKWPDERCNSWRFPDDEWCHIDRRRKIDRLSDIDYLAHAVEQAERKRRAEWAELRELTAEELEKLHEDECAWAVEDEWQRVRLLNQSWEYCAVTDILDRHALVFGRGDNAGKWYLQTASGQRESVNHRGLFETVAKAILEDGRPATAENIRAVYALLKEAA